MYCAVKVTIFRPLLISLDHVENQLWKNHNIIGRPLPTFRLEMGETTTAEET